MNKFKNILLTIIITFIFVFVAFVTYNLAEPKAYDFMTKHFLTEKLPFDKYKKVHGSDDIVIVVVDLKSVEEHRWPWKRELYGQVFDYFQQYAKPKSVVFDYILVNLDADNPQSDKKFFRSVKTFDNLVVGFMPSNASWKNKIFGEIYDKKMSNRFAINVTDKSNQVADLYSSSLAMPDAYFNSIKNIGSVLMLPGFINGNLSPLSIDEVYRTHGHLFKYKGCYYPSLALKTFLLLNNNPEIFITNNSIKIPDKNIEIKYKKAKYNNTYYYQTITPVKYYKPYDTGYSHKHYSAIDIIHSYEALKAGKKPVIDPSIFRDKVVIFGGNVPTGTGLNDNKNTPVLINHPGVDYQATSIENILYNDFLKTVPMALNIFVAILGALLVYFFIRICSLYKSIVTSLSVILLYFLICSCCFYFGIIINVITPIVLFVITTIFAYSHKFILENKNKEKVKSAMGKYMSQDVMKRVIQDIDNLGLGGKRANVTVLFSDIRGFTSMSEQMSPQQVSEILNEYFTEMEPIITQHNGIINKFIGDAVMAVFGEPIQDKNHAINAVKCAYAMLQKVKELQKKWAQEDKPKIEIGIGIATGEVFVGNIGSINRMEYTVIGDTVNLASRLEGYNKTYKTKLLISPTTYENIKGFVDVIKISDVQIRGKANKMDIYEVLRVI